MANFAALKEILHFSIQILFIKFKVPLVRVGLLHFLPKDLVKQILRSNFALRNFRNEKFATKNSQ